MYLIDVYNYLTGGSEEELLRLFTVAPSDRTRGNGHKSKHIYISSEQKKNPFCIEDS